MGQALIQQEDKIDPYLDTLFTTYFVRSLMIGLILILFAHPLGNFFHLGDSYTVFWAIVPLPILQSLQSPRLISLYRRLDFHCVTILNVSEVAASFRIQSLAVLYWRDWRGLVLSLLVGAVVRDILTSSRIGRGSPRARHERKRCCRSECGSASAAFCASSSRSNSTI